MRGLLIAIISLLFVSCTTTKYIETTVPVETVRTEYINQLYTDSIYIHDSIDRYISGDTVYQYKYKYKYIYKNHTDTIIKTDSIEVPVEVRTIQEVNKIKWYQSFLMYFGFGFILILLYKGIKFGRSYFKKNS